MVSNKSLDDSKLIAALLNDVFSEHGAVFNSKSRRCTLSKVQKRLSLEGLGFLTKALPRLAKAFDKALAGGTPLNSVDHGFESMPGSKLPRFLGELFSRVLQTDGTLLPEPCSKSVRTLRQFLFVYYKYELPYTDELEQQVISKFERTENELTVVSSALYFIRSALDAQPSEFDSRHKPTGMMKIARRARDLLSDLFRGFDPKDIHPRHGPGAVATKQQLWDKYLWTNVSKNITTHYPLDEYFYASLSHVCDEINSFNGITDNDLPARVILVPKDSRGPRLISCEPVDYQWVQQGLGRAIVTLVEGHYLTRDSVFFTDQVPNRIGALLGSSTLRYATLDLNEASDRVSLELVRLLFPPHLCGYLEACRSSSTVLPNGKVLPLLKFAPMGSCLCFPIMALSIWAILTAAAPDAYTRERIHVYGDDVIVPTAYAADAMKQLESFGLKINRDKSCTGGLFRESCGMDAFQGADVTPVRLRTVWSSSPSPSSYVSWIAYANSFWLRGYFHTYEYIVGLLHHLYGAISAKDMNLSCPSLWSVSDHNRPKKRRSNKSLQKLQWFVRDVKSVAITKHINGWSMLLRYFSEKANSFNDNAVARPGVLSSFDDDTPFSASQYTRRRTSMLVRRWR
jgi:hypothetical protein